MQEIKDYLGNIPREELELIALQHFITASPDSGCAPPTPLTPVNPNGYWSCVSGKWTWIPGT